MKSKAFVLLILSVLFASVAFFQAWGPNPNVGMVAFYAFSAFLCLVAIHAMVLQKFFKTDAKPESFPKQMYGNRGLHNVLT